MKTSLLALALALAAQHMFGGKKPKQLPKEAADALNKALRESAKKESSIPGML